METVVRLEDVTRRFGQTEAAVDVSFGVQRGEIFGLLGHNGAGKTTLIRLINGLLRPDSGHIQTLGMDPIRQGREVRRHSGVLTTYPGLDEYLSPAENLAVYGAIHGLPRDECWSRTVRLLSRLGLDPRSHEPARGLSAGLKQRVALARALVHEPELLLLDEPTANLDPIAARDVRDMVRELAESGRTIIFSTHNLAEAESLCDRVAILRQGHLIAVGSLDELASGRLRGRGVELQVAAQQVEQAMQAIGPLVNGHVNSVHGHRIRISTAGPDDVAGIIRALVAAGIDVHGATPTLPSLEDVYLAVHEPTVTP